MYKNSIYILILINFILVLSSCATAPTYTAPTLPPGLPGIHHKVEGGQTLWQIARLYNIDIDTLINTNHISDAAKIETGQLILIPYQQQKPYLSQEYSNEDFIWPLKGQVIAAFGQPYNDIVNKGLDIKTQYNTNILAARRGKVCFYAPEFKGFGRTIIVDHGDGFSTVYSGVSDSLVRPGETVEKGAAIAKGNYLHFEIRKGYVSQNPYFYLP